ncbi:MAG TPA: LacI family DNA-binding transcriptional regulator, partial [Acidimicrobiales bacterium]|nr:LacI family DNA-binding transcriptional regulator [Acidimicrobiales bacterium]
MRATDRRKDGPLPRQKASLPRQSGGLPRQSGVLSRQHGGVPTMRDVAELSGVSVMTVSRVLHDDARITETTKTRVRDAVRELGYVRNLTARNLRMGRGAGAVGLVIGNLANPFYSQLAVGI